MKLRLASILSICALALTLVIGLSVGTEQSVAAPLGTTDEITYLPLVAKPPDLSITNLEISQAIQDVNNSVPLVANRPAVVRIYTETSSGSSVPGSSITLTATRGGSSLTPITSATMTASAASSRSDLGSTFNITLPNDWLSGTVQMTAKIDGQTGGGFGKTITFNTVPTLNVMLVPINYTHTPTGTTFPGPTAERIGDWLMRAYPLSNMSITVHTPYNFSGNLQEGAAWSNLLDQVTTLKSNDSAPSSTVYYGYIDFDCGWVNCSGSFIAGIGWLGSRASVGIDFPSMETTGELAGHEFGHNFDRDHAPCNVNGDPNYPYAGASIGQYGLDGIGGSLQLLSPSGYVDMMSYCDPVWVSDYTYKALYNDQVANGAFIWTPTQESLLIQGSVADDGAVTLNPVYILPQTAPTSSAVSPQNNFYQVELLDSVGNIIATHPIDLLVAEEEGVSVRAVRGVVPLPNEPVAELRIVEVASQTAVANRTLSTASMAVSASLAQSSSSATVSWGLTDVPANVRYTVNDGQTWTTVGLNVLGGSLEVDLSGLPGGGNGRFQIILADQATPTRLDVDLATPLTDKQPTVWISGSSSLSAESPTALYAFGSDAEEGALTEFVWSVDGEVVTTPTFSLFLNELSVGEHVITLTATTSSGQIATTSVVVTVTP
jgi:hypothetical protein